MNEMHERRRGLLDATVFALAGIAILIGLGVWQLDRKIWKEQLIATTMARLGAVVPGALPSRDRWDQLGSASDEFRRVAFPAELLNDKEAFVYTSGSALRSDVTGQGYWVFTPARLPGGSVVVVNRGFVPTDHKDPVTRP
ncbi:MAG: SURF1 family protein, partial [Pseudolabrys sp.]|nr:SURF1 family protein [Pseudolabrys sp.]